MALVVGTTPSAATFLSIKLKSHHTGFIVVGALRPRVPSSASQDTNISKMSIQVPQFLVRTLLILIVASLACANARPSHFADSNQVVADQEPNNLLESGLKPWQLELFLQKLSEVNNQPGNEYAWERSLRSPEMKRQSRYRQCYFNPISCFKK